MQTRKTNIQRKCNAAVSFLTLLIIAITTLQASASETGPIPSKLDIPSDFQATKADWIDNERPNAGWFLGITMLRGKGIQERNGVFPIHIMKAECPQFTGTPFMQDDLIIAVNGKPLGTLPENQFVQEVERTRKKSGILKVTRWRKGVIETVSLRLQSKQEQNIPDLTAGGKPDETRDWALGSIGANGWGYSQKTKNGGSDKARQLLITLVDENGPTANKLKVGDVVIGINGNLFTDDARKALAAAINDAEKKENHGILDLYVWRNDKAESIPIRIPVLGTYSKTTPFDCPKTEMIIDRAVRYMQANKDSLLKPSEKGWINYINGLGLLATGRDDVMPIVKELAHGSLLKPGEKLSVEKHVPMQCWWWSYKTVFLCEYYLRTKDAAVLPTIEEHATKIAMGQSGAGTWGHTYAAKENTGYLHGHLGGYGAINQQGLTLMIALPLAVKCGVKNQEVMDAIERGNDFFSFFIGKGTIPYGDHGAAPWYDDNGKSGAAAILFDLMNNREGTRFFSEMILASSPGGRESGHTGHFWSHLWGGMGAARGGDKALQVFMEQMQPIFTLERQYDGRFVFQDNVGEKGDQGKPKSKWDCTGARLLQLCIPKRKLYITGKETPKETHLTEARIAQLLKAGKLNIDATARDQLTRDEIFTLLADPLSPTRAIGVRALEERELNCVDALIDMLDSENRFAQYGAAEALGRVGFASQKAADKLIKMMQYEEDTLLRLYAIGALTSSNKRLGLVTVAKPAIPVLLKMAVEHAEDDPRRVLQHDIGRALFYNGRAQPRTGLFPLYGLDGVDRDLLIPAIKEILTNKNGWARSTMTSFIYPHLTTDELNNLWGDIYRATRHIAPSGIMFASGARTDGLRLMAKHKVEEGIYLAAWYVRWQKNHGSRRRIPAALESLEKYGTHAQSVVPYLEEHANYFKSKRPPGREPAPDDAANLIATSIQKIKQAEAVPKLISIAEYITPEDVPPKDGP
jgi:hypothetical protein